MSILSFLEAEASGLLPTAITIGGVKIPLALFKPLLSDSWRSVLTNIQAGKPPHEIIASLKADVGPEAIAVVESVANIIYPGAGTAIQIVAWLVEHQKPMTQDDVNAWMDRFGAKSDSA